MITLHQISDALFDRIQADVRRRRFQVRPKVDARIQAVLLPAWRDAHGIYAEVYVFLFDEHVAVVNSNLRPRPMTYVFRLSGVEHAVDKALEI